MGKNKLPTLIFCSFFDNQQKFVKEFDMSKKVAVTDLLNPQNPGKVFILPKSAIVCLQIFLCA